MSCSSEDRHRSIKVDRTSQEINSARIDVDIPNETSPATAISWKLRLKVWLICETRLLNVGSHLSCKILESEHFLGILPQYVCTRVKHLVIAQPQQR